MFVPCENTEVCYLWCCYGRICVKKYLKIRLGLKQWFRQSCFPTTTFDDLVEKRTTEMMTRKGRQQTGQTLRTTDGKTNGMGDVVPCTRARLRNKFFDLASGWKLTLRDSPSCMGSNSCPCMMYSLSSSSSSEDIATAVRSSEPTPVRTGDLFRRAVYKRI